MLAPKLMTQILFKVLGAALSIWESKEKTKYQDEFLRLKKEWHEENDQPDHYRSQLALDRIERELRVLSESFAYSVTGTNPSNQP
jgi:hypothetical protein